MHVLEQHEIAEADLRVLNPFSEDKLMLLGEVCRLEPGMRQLDLCSGKGELLCRWAQRWGTGGVGIDISTVFVPLAQARADQLGVADRVRFERGDAAQPSADVLAAAPYDVVSCIGATWIGNGLVGTIELMRPLVRPDGLILVGEPFWFSESTAADQAAVSESPEAFATLSGTLDRFTSTGLELVEMVLADHDSWDRYSATQWWTVERWLRANPDHPGHDEMRAYLVDGRRQYLAARRDRLGWGVFVLRAPA